MRIVTRPIARTDADTIAAIHTASWRDSYRGMLRDEYLERDIESERRSVWQQRMEQLEVSHFGFIAEDDGMPVGFAFLKGVFDARWGTLLDNLHVLPGLKGQGIGRVLIEAAARETRDRYPGDPLYLWVFEKNMRARRFYARLGGREIERVIIEPPGGGKAPEWRIAWDSPASLLECIASANRTSPSKAARTGS